MPRAPAAALMVSEGERRELLQVHGLRSVPQSVALRLRIVLGAAEGIGNKVLARQLSTSLPTVLLWRGRFQMDGLPGLLEDRPRSGRPKEIGHAGLVADARHRRTPRIGASVSWHESRASARRRSNASGRNMTSNRIVWNPSEVQHRPAVCHQSARHRGPLPESARQGDCAERGREEPNSSIRPDAADSAAPARLAGAADT